MGIGVDRRVAQCNVLEYSEQIDQDVNVISLTRANLKIYFARYFVRSSSFNKLREFSLDYRFVCICRKLKVAKVQTVCRNM